jgi:acetyltransferase-like isoleucine patch superfamily enzyme
MDLNIRLCKLWQGATSRVRQWALRFAGVRFEGHCWIQGIEWPLRPRCITLGAGAMLDRRVVLLATSDESRIVIGARSYLNRDVFIDASASVEIGPDAMIGPGCYITDHDHVFNGADAPGALPLVAEPTQIGARCWIGARVIVLKGVSIGEGTVVGAGSVVVKSLPAGVVAVGNPARVVKSIAP